MGILKAGIGGGAELSREAVGVDILNATIDSLIASIIDA